MNILTDYRHKEAKNRPTFVPDEMLSEDQAFKNHGQTLKRLNERGGMSIPEILCNIHGKRLYEVDNGYFKETQEKIDELNLLIEKFKNK